MGRVVLRAATADDWIVLLGVEPPPVSHSWVADLGYMLAGLGGFYRAEDGRWWVTFVRAPGIRHTLTANKAARLALHTADEMEITLNAIADTRIAGAEQWLERLGFRRTDERHEGHEGHDVWTR